MPFCKILLGYPRESRRDALGRPLGCDPHAFQLAGRDARAVTEHWRRSNRGCRCYARIGLLPKRGTPGKSRLGRRREPPAVLSARHRMLRKRNARTPARRTEASGLLAVTQGPSRNTGGAATGAADATHGSVFRQSAERPAKVSCAGGRNRLPHCLYATACCGSVKLA